MLLTRNERNNLLGRLRELEGRLFPLNDAEAPTGRAAARLNEACYQLLAEYGDRLPRVIMGACPFTGAPLKCSFDPYGLDGPWWWKDCPFEIDEPKPPAAFRVLLGALNLHGRLPAEATDEVIPGPEVPFVVPRLLAMPGMVAVVSRLELITGDVAYPVSYWSATEFAAEDLHQPWLRQELWFDNDEGSQSWLIANDPWDFELERWIAGDKLFWLEPGGEKVLGRTTGGKCPFLGLKGDLQPQSLAGGERELLELPDGSPINPFPED
ncbi:MAG: hypothetical protein IH623_21825 [Verrucomicrobia bacterium]|nr:hypothetical protein [Verrucomicrobiota bacterium]